MSNTNDNKLPDFGPTVAYLYKTKGSTMTHWTPVMNEKSAAEYKASFLKAAEECQVGARIALKVNSNKKTEKSPDAFVIVQTVAEVAKMKNSPKPATDSVGF